MFERNGPLTSLAVAVTATSLALAGCCKRPSGSSGSGTGSSGISNTTGSTSGLVQLPSAKVQFRAPAGWVKYTASGWTLFKPPDNTARLGFVTFTRPGESTQRIGQLAGALDLGAVAWKGDQVSKSIGAGSFPSKSAVGSCKFTTTGVPCEVWYATVDTGTSEQLLIVYAVNTTGSPVNKNNAEAAVGSLARM